MPETAFAALCRRFTAQLRLSLPVLFGKPVKMVSKDSINGKGKGPATSWDEATSSLGKRVWTSIFPVPIGDDAEKRRRFLRSQLVFHFRPATVKEKTLRLNLTWGLGGMATTLILLQMVTGILLTFSYVPTPADAYVSVQSMITQIPFGRLVRNLHHWSANFLVVVVLLHMLRVFFTAAFHPPRQLNWLIGLFLFGLVLTANLTGYLLPYDQLAYWATTVVAAMIGYLPLVGDSFLRMMGDGMDLGPQTLLFFFSLHTSVIPVLLLLLMAFHFWRIRKAGGVVVPRKPREQIDPKPSRVPTFPHLLVRELTVFLTLTATVLVFSIGVDAPLAGPANPGMSPAVVRAPWYFAGVQELLLHVHPTVTVTMAPALVCLFLVSIPYLPYGPSTEGIWFASVRGRKQAVVTALTSLVIVLLLVVLDTALGNTFAWKGGTASVLWDCIGFLALIGLPTATLVIVLRKKAGFTLAETVQLLFVVLITALLALTFVGTFFRGSSMQLVWPV